MRSTWALHDVLYCRSSQPHRVLVDCTVLYIHLPLSPSQLVRLHRARKLDESWADPWGRAVDDLSCWKHVCATWVKRSTSDRVPSGCLLEPSGVTYICSVSIYLNRRQCNSWCEKAPSNAPGRITGVNCTFASSFSFFSFWEVRSGLFLTLSQVAYGFYIQDESQTDVHRIQNHLPSWAPNILFGDLSHV